MLANTSLTKGARTNGLNTGARRSRKTVSLPPALSTETVTAIAGLLYPAAAWIDQFGRPHYGMDSERYLRAACAGTSSGGERSKERLPVGWDARLLGRDYVIFHNCNPEFGKDTRTRAGRPAELPEEVISRIRAASSSHTRRGWKTALAKQLGISEAMVTRVLRYERRSGNRSKRPHPADLHVGSVSGQLVDELLAGLVTQARWLRTFGRTPSSTGVTWLSVEIGDQKFFYHQPTGF